MTDTQREPVHFEPKDGALRDDVRELGAIVGAVIAEQCGAAVFAAVEQIRQAAITQRETGQRGDLRGLLDSLDTAAASDVIRGFSTYFQVVNIAEKVHRIRRRREWLRDTRQQRSDSLEGAMRLLAEQLPDPRRAMAFLDALLIEPVFTAHPTEPTRRTILLKQQQVARRLVERMNPVADAAGTRGAAGQYPRPGHLRLADGRASQHRHHRRRRARTGVVLPRGEPLSRHPGRLRTPRAGASPKCGAMSRSRRARASFSASAAGSAATWTATRTWGRTPFARRSPCTGARRWSFTAPNCARWHASCHRPRAGSASPPRCWRASRNTGRCSRKRWRTSRRGTATCPTAYGAPCCAAAWRRPRAARRTAMPMPRPSSKTWR